MILAKNLLYVLKGIKKWQGIAQNNLSRSTIFFAKVHKAFKEVIFLFLLVLPTLYWLYRTCTLYPTLYQTIGATELSKCVWKPVWHRFLLQMCRQKCGKISQKVLRGKGELSRMTRINRHFLFSYKVICFTPGTIFLRYLHYQYLEGERSQYK